MLKTFDEFSSSLNEGFWDWLAGKQQPEKEKPADSKVGALETKIDNFYKSLEEFANSGKAVPVQSYGSMKYSKLVEDIQVALSFLGYPLEKHGIDGFFGPETAAAIVKFNEDTLPKTLEIQND